MAEGAASISFGGQLISGIILLLLGFIPGYVVSFIMKKMGILRVPAEIEEMGLDLAEIGHESYPESNVPASQTPSAPATGAMASSSLSNKL